MAFSIQLVLPSPHWYASQPLRNVATTPPYFHDGSAPTLSEAVKTMGNAQLDRVLTDQQVAAAIVAFLNTLTGTLRLGRSGPPRPHLVQARRSP